MTSAFFLNWLQSLCPVKLQCSFPSLQNMEETSEELPNFSIGIDCLGLDPRAAKKKKRKKFASCAFRKFQIGRRISSDNHRPILYHVISFFPMRARRNYSVGYNSSYLVISMCWVTWPLNEIGPTSGLVSKGQILALRWVTLFLGECEAWIGVSVLLSGVWNEKALCQWRIYTKSFEV